MKIAVEATSATLFAIFDPGTLYGSGTMIFDVPDGGRRLFGSGARMAFPA